MLDEETWTVVKFVEEASVAAVPTKWIMDDKCLWPPFPTEKLNAAIKNQKFDTCWPSHTVQVFRNATYDSYETARLKARKAEDTSELSSTDTSQRRRKFFRRYSSSDSLEELEILPKMPSPPSKRKRIVSERVSTVTETTPHKSVQLTEKNVTPSTSTRCNCCPHHAEVNTEILRQLYFLRSVHTDLLNEVRNLKAKEDVCEDVVTVFSTLKVPCHTDEDLNDLEFFLKTPDNFLKMVNELCKCGGSNILDFIKRCMSTLITNKLAIDYSWLGRRSKKGFCNLNIAAVIVEGAIKSRKCSEKKVVEEEIAKWLRRAGDRLKTFTKEKEPEQT